MMKYIMNNNNYLEKKQNRKSKLKWQKNYLYNNKTYLNKKFKI